MNYTGIKKLLAVSAAVPVFSALSAPVSNGTLDAAVPTAGSTGGSSVYTLDALGNVTENGVDIGRNTNEWVRSALTKGFEYSAAGGVGGTGAFIQNSTADMNAKPRAVLQFAKDSKASAGAVSISMDVYFDENGGGSNLYFNVELYGWNSGDTAPGLSTGGGTANDNTYNVTTLNDAVTLLDNRRLNAADFPAAAWETAEVSSLLGLGDGYDYYAWRIGVIGADPGDEFAFDNLTVTPFAVNSDTNRPNIILVMADDMGYGDPSYMNVSVLQADGTAHPDQGWISTPNMDAMASAGLRFDRFYSASAVCSPTRASCLTGRNPYRVGVPYANSGHMGADETPLSEILSTMGYVSGHFGKWHLGTMTSLRSDANRGAAGNTSHYYAPWHFEYDACFATESKVPTYHPYRISSNGTALPTAYTNDAELGYMITDTNFYGTHYWTMPDSPATAGEGTVVTLDEVNNIEDGDDSKLLTDQAISFIEEAVSSNKPFFVVLWYHTPHAPVVDPDQVSSVNSGDAIKDSIEDLDTAVGDLRSTLETLGVRDNTMLWLTSDNGPEISLDSDNETDTNRSIRSGGLRDRKRSFYEGGIRVPGILEWPNGIADGGRTTEFVASTSDYYPTVLDYLGLSTPDQKALDGISLRPVIENQLEERPSPVGFLIGSTTASADQQAWIMQDYKLVYADSTWQLFDMTLPDHELEITPLATESNVTSQAQEVQDIYNSMMADYTAWKTSVDADSVYSNAAAPAVTLSAVSETEEAFSVTVSFSMDVEGLELDEFIISGGSAAELSGSGSGYTIEVTPSYFGDISVSLPQAAAFADDGTPSLPSNELLVDVTNALEVETSSTAVDFSSGSYTTVDPNDLSPAAGDNNLDKFDGDGEPFATDLYVRSAASPAERRVKAVLKFDLSPLDASAVDSAMLYLRGYSLNDIYDVSLEAVGAAEDGLISPSYTLGTFGTPADGGSVSTGLDADLMRSYELDVTEMVAAWVDGSRTNHGFVLQLESDTVNNGVGFQAAGDDAPWLEVNQIPLKVIRYELTSGTNAQISLTAQGGSGETYYLHKSENLLSNDWVLVDSVTSSNAFSRFEDSVNASTSAFYRISVEP